MAMRAGRAGRLYYVDNVGARVRDGLLQSASDTDPTDPRQGHRVRGAWLKREMAAL